MSGCFSLGPMKSLSSAQYKQYQSAWQTFNNVWDYNIQVSTIIGSNPSANISYYRFTGNIELQHYRQGQILHSIAYPTSNWNSVGTG